MDAWNLPRRSVLGKVKFVEVKNVLLHFLHSLHAFVAKKADNCFGHAAAHEVTSVLRFQFVEDNFRQVTGIMQIFYIAKRFLIGSTQKLSERDGIHTHDAYLAHRHRHAAPLHRYAKQTASGNDMVRWRIFIEVF